MYVAISMCKIILIFFKMFFQVENTESALTKYIIMEHSSGS